MNYTHVVFVLTTNHLNKVDQGIINRSIVLDMNSAPTTAWVNKIKSIYAASGKTPPPDQAIAGVVNAGNGSARTILTDIEIAQSIRERQFEDE